MEIEVTEIIDIIKNHKIKEDAKVIIFFLQNLKIQSGIMNLLNIDNKIEKRFIQNMLRYFSKELDFSELLDGNNEVKLELKQYLIDRINYRVVSNKFYIEYNPIYYKQILKIKETYKILKINDDDFMSYLIKIKILEDKEEIILQEVTLLIDELIKLNKDIKIRLQNIGKFQNQNQEEKQIKKASDILITYAKKTGNHKMIKYLQNIPYIWQTKRDILNLYEESARLQFELFCLKVSEELYDLISEKFAKQLVEYIE